jgi:uncharacterized membrane protein HdeD (DUF308 family)
MRVHFSFGSGHGPRHHRGPRYHRGPRNSSRRHYGHRHGGGVEVSSRGFKVLLGIILLIIGGICLYFNYSKSSKYDNYLECYGRVIDYDTGSNYNMWAEVVEYEVGGVTYRVTSSSYSNMPREIGDLVKVKYNPYAPSRAIVDKLSDSIILYVVGGAFAVVGFISLISSIKGNSKEEID